MSDRPYGLAMNFAPAGNSNMLGKVRPDVMTILIDGHFVATRCAKDTPFICPGISMSVKMASIEVLPSKIVKASEGVAASCTVKPSSRRASEITIRINTSSSTTMRTKGFPSEQDKISPILKKHQQAAS